MMAHENTKTEQDMDATTHKFAQSLRGDSGDHEPDLSVDGLSDSIVSRIFRVLTFRRS
jgi:hypothetical protein